MQWCLQNRTQCNGVSRIERNGWCACAGADHFSEFAPVNIHSKLHFRLNIITFSRNSNLYSSSGGADTKSSVLKECREEEEEEEELNAMVFPE